ncbi:histidine kinase [Pedobacter sp. SD-b]|uniref:Histidine kinase n=1 Tax=Pedobacter segetis TaxID=2793069 RepID=A0ABS1BI69_9SPHI|nr:histidine kinase [Pedobacter segetis]MBK0382578.1 histidine kinase [Pedobacter segetis]
MNFRLGFKLFFKVLIVIFFICISSNVSCQQNESLKISNLKGINYFFDIQQISLAKTNKETGIETVFAAKFTSNKRLINIEKDKAYWFKIPLFNDLDQDIIHFIYCGNNDYTELYEQREDSVILLGRAGTLNKTSVLQIENIPYYFSFKIKKGEKKNIFVKVFNKGNHSADLDLSLEDSNTFDQEILKYYQTSFKDTFIPIVFIGSLSFLFFFMIFLFLKSYHKIYLFYSLYLLGAIIYALMRLDRITYIGSLLGEFPLFRIYINEPIQFLFFAVYHFFVIYLLDIKKYDPKLVKVLKSLSYVYICYAVLHFFMMYFYYPLQLRSTLFVITRIILVPLNIILVVWAAKKVKTPVLNYFLVGVSCYIFSGFLAAFVDYRFQSFQFITLGLNSLNVFQLGILAEVLCFSLAIGYRIRITEKDKNNNQLALINQLQINKQLIESSNLELEQKVNERTQKLIAVNREMEQRKLTSLKLDFERKIAEAEMQALRSQMNPHFLFNSLNSIRYLVMSNQDEKAVNYLNKFSRLIRLILENSRKEKINLNQELTALRLYLDIEANRFEEKFTYNITVSPKLNTNEIYLPPLLLQPFIENAIWHGLLNSNRTEKAIDIRINPLNENDKSCQILIEDNGIGRKKSESLKSKFKKHQSYGMLLTQERIALFNNTSTTKIYLKIVDMETNGLPDGTKIILSLK